MWWRIYWSSCKVSIIIIITMYICHSSLKYPLISSDFNEAWIFSTDFLLFTNIKFHKNPSSGNRVVPCVQTVGWTDMTKLIFVFRNYAKTLEKEMFSITQTRTLRLLGQTIFSYRNCCDVYRPVPLLCLTADAVWPTLVYFRVRSYSQCLTDGVNCKMAATRKCLS
jgi:hypothetical protein